MTYTLTEGDAKHWDWLPEAAREVENYLKWLMAEESVRVHEISARAKSIASLLSKIRLKETLQEGRVQGADADAVPPLSSAPHESAHSPHPTHLDDVIAARVIVYSERDRDRAIELVRDRFSVLPNEDKNPGHGRPVGLMGYESWHFVVDGVKNPSDLIGEKSNLSVFFTKFHGLEIQIRTVAAHAWAEFEHTHRYKSSTYRSLKKEGQEQVDDILRDAHAYRKQLDQALNEAMRVLDQAAPTESFVDTADPANSAESTPPDEGNAGPTLLELSTASLRASLAQRYPTAAEPSERGLEFGVTIVRALGITSLSALEAHLDDVKSERVAALLDTEGKATTVRRLDDDLLALFGSEYIEATRKLGESPFRERRPGQLAWRWSLIKPKATKRNIYAIQGADAPEKLRTELRSAAGAVRDLVQIVGNRLGAQVLEDRRLAAVVGVDRELPSAARARRLDVGEHAVWVHSNFRIDSAEEVMGILIDLSGPLDLQVVRSGTPLLPVSSGLEQEAEAALS
ncbi:hypothetical protein C5E10_04600 [Pseudoclavibacter sp. RFBG4]|uniref:GTP pyrophosphokinase n=1 Tax=Pseudoclavibacter sp. RFBG4 TaxID=2080575 RepID=UPI000CE86C81|nr:RelA/SpoT domain-containing protein [Pseudoclavibacter sp. RFBG4]PPG35251.1 hypothetical protein C5E10_04600 [Pseudoclavibacter sp. RFBG4]